MVHDCASSPRVEKWGCMLARCASARVRVRRSKGFVVGEFSCKQVLTINRSQGSCVLCDRWLQDGRNGAQGLVDGGAPAPRLGPQSRLRALPGSHNCANNTKNMLCALEYQSVRASRRS